MSSKMTPSADQPGLKEDELRVLRALRWIREKDEVTRAGFAEMTSHGMAWPDALVEDPRRLVSAAQTVIEAAKEAGAPEEIARSLQEIADRMEEGASELFNHSYAIETIQGLKGLRDRYELEPVLARAIREAPDDASRRILQKFLRAIQRPLELDLSLPPVMLDCDWGCCAFTCIMCTQACLICCGLACIFC